jgi:hypothetical protein
MTGSQSSKSKQGGPETGITRFGLHVLDSVSGQTHKLLDVRWQPSPRSVTAVHGLPACWLVALSWDTPMEGQSPQPELTWDVLM